MVDERTGQLCDFTRKSGVDQSFILAPIESPDWVFDRSQMWNSVELAERSSDSQVASEMNLALPTELTLQENEDLLRGWVEEQCVSQGMVADVAIHDADSHNPHTHVMLSMRRISVEDWGKSWAEHVNKTLELHGHDERIDHRTLKEQDIERDPQIHVGVIALAMAVRG